MLIEAGASLVLEDTKGRIPIDLISGPVNRAIANPLNSGTASGHIIQISFQVFKVLKRCGRHSRIFFYSELRVTVLSCDDCSSGPVTSQ